MRLEKLIYIRNAVGKNRVLFDCYKIRTMPEDHVNLDMCSENFNQYGHPKSDEAIGGLAGFLRATGVDELPQIINMVKGDMGVVGVRPAVEEFWSMIPKDLREKALRYKPGFFGFQYAYNGEGNFQTYLSNLRAYLDKKEVNPILTDLRYLLIIIFNKSFRGVRSS